MVSFRSKNASQPRSEAQDTSSRRANTQPPVNESPPPYSEYVEEEYDSEWDGGHTGFVMGDKAKGPSAPTRRDQQNSAASDQGYLSYEKLEEIYHRKDISVAQKLNLMVWHKGASPIIDMYFISALIINTPDREKSRIKREYEMRFGPKRHGPFRRGANREWKVITDINNIFKDAPLKPMADLQHIMLLGARDQAARTFERATHGTGTNENGANFTLFNRTSEFIKGLEKAYFDEDGDVDKKFNAHERLEYRIRDEYSGNVEHVMLALINDIHTNTTSFNEERKEEEQLYLDGKLETLMKGPAIARNSTAVIMKGTQVVAEKSSKALTSMKGFFKGNKKREDSPSEPTQSDGYKAFGDQTKDKIRDLEDVVKAILHTSPHHLRLLEKMLQDQHRSHGGRFPGLVECVQHWASANDDIRWLLLYAVRDALNYEENDLRILKEYEKLNNKKTFEWTHSWNSACLLLDTCCQLAWRGKEANDRSRLNNLLNGPIYDVKLQKSLKSIAWMEERFKELGCPASMTKSLLEGFIKGTFEVPPLGAVWLEHLRYQGKRT